MRLKLMLVTLSVTCALVIGSAPSWDFDFERSPSGKAFTAEKPFGGPVLWSTLMVDAEARSAAADNGRRTTPVGAVAQHDPPPLDRSARRLDVALMSHVKRLVFLSDSPLFRRIRKPLWNMFYSGACRDFIPEEHTRFLNFGYLSEEGELDRVGEDANVADLVSERLYDRTVSGFELADRVVVEVGCGPGAGSAHLARGYRPALCTGVDLNMKMIELCRQRYALENLRFCQGDAENLPLADASVDAIVNVESSHSYRSRSRFFEEVVRVLRPGGALLLADLVIPSTGEGADDVSALLAEAGMVVQERSEITANVRAARDAVASSRFRARLRESVSSIAAPFIEETFCLPGTRPYAGLVSGRVQYFRWLAVRPVAHFSHK
ncbi:MAG TPA: class I SAM-dependent methyltransferase [Solirubrobacteraceae bacterium]|nr:class I SAM-dependent methyltransferase [Solirubrobacteraceae bacterium]